MNFVPLPLASNDSDESKGIISAYFKLSPLPSEVRIGAYLRSDSSLAGARLCLKDQPQRAHKWENIQIGFQRSLPFGAFYHRVPP